MMRNQFVVGEEFVRIIDPNGKEIWIDEEDLEMVSSAVHGYWRVGKRGYVQGWNGKETLLLHRVIMNTPPRLHVDHRNHFKFDNRKTNLVNCTNSENRSNKIPYLAAYKEHEKRFPNKNKKREVGTIDEILISESAMLDKLKVDRKTLYNYRQQGLPYIKLGRRVYFRKESFEKWLVEQEMKA